ncbi:MAG: hypothetical protein H6739_40050 [Alphaproteobacteria bacterium]|nr:hypothetical protein [Alphaproteobacteria bacterium]
MLTALLLLACAQPTCPSLDDLGLDPGLTAQPGPETAFPDFALGVEYNATGLASAYGRDGLNARWAKTRLEAFEWGMVEARRGQYDWSCPDAQIGEWQQAGVEQLQSYFTSKSSWGSRGVLDYVPKDADRDAFLDWVEALIERYDGDGVDDMPGLVRPVRHWVFGGEWTGFWPSGDADSYLDLMADVRQSAQAASDEVLLGSIPFFMIDVFEGNEPTEEEIEARWQDDPPGDRHDLESHLAILDGHALFDYVNVHSLGDYTELPPTHAWMQGELEARGADLPIWIDDAFPAHFLANNGTRPAWYPTTEENYDAVYAVLQAVAEDPEGQSAETAWIRAETAKGTVKKAVTALGEGFVGIQIGNTVDWMSADNVALRRSNVSLIGAAAMMGMIDAEHPEGLSLGAVLVPGPERPAWHAFDLVQQLLGDEPWDTVERIGGTTGLRGYRLERGARTLWVVWSEDGVLQLPGEAESTETLRLETDAAAVMVTVTPTTDGGWASETVEAVNGEVELTIGEAPVFVEDQ